MKTETLQGFQLSPQQKHLWLLQQGSNIYLSQAVIEITGKIDLKVLQAAFQKIIDRQEILRTNFYRRSGISIPFQVIAQNNQVLWQSIELKDLSKQEIKLQLLELLQSEKSAKFDLELDSILRLLLINLNEDCQYLIITLPSLCVDSQTINNLVKELSQSYSFYLQRKEFVEEPVQYIQFSEWQNELLTEASKTEQNYWQQQHLKYKNLILPGELNNEVNLEFESNIYSIKIKDELIDKISLIVTQYNSNLAIFLRTCWYILIGRLTNNSRIAIANLFSGRKYEELNNTFGLLAQFLPVNCIVSKQFSFSEILSDLENNLHQAEQYQEYYLGENSEEKTKEYPTPLIGFEFEELPDRYNANGISFSIYKKDIHLENFKIKLTCQQQQDYLITEFHYDTNRFSSETIALLAQQFCTLVESVTDNPEATVGELNILDRQQRHQLLVEFNDNATNYPQDKCIHQLFEAQAIKTPNNIAIVYDSEQLTYSELNSKANNLANHLKQTGVKPETLVGLYLDRSHLSIIGLLGILKAGAAYLPLDSALPTEGLTFRVQDAGVSVLLTQRSLLPKIPASAEYTICLDTDWETIAEDRDSSHHKVKPDNLVYAIYTSGSTGTPKVVAIEHRQLVNYVYSIVERFNISSGASFATVSTLAADLGNTMLFPALCTGGCLHIIDRETASDPQAFNNYCQHHPIDYLKIVPSHLSALLSSSPEAGFLPRKKLILGGESSNWQLIAKIQQQQPNCQIFNHYGPTETTVGVLTYQIEPETDRQSNTVPIGKPLANNQVYILDEQLQPVPIGVPGELYIGGVQVSRGYLNRPELTKKKFIPNPLTHDSTNYVSLPQSFLYKTGDSAKYLPKGNIEFLGRIDRQVKIRGFRIELGEIESKLQQHPDIQSVVVIADRESLDNKRLIAYIVTNPQFRFLHRDRDTAIASELRSFCVDRFPEYMIPSAFVVLKALPLTANGKIDYQALPTPEQSRPELKQLYIAPRSLLEQQLAEIWTEVLGLEEIGIHDNFFELGGHSLLITQLLAKVRTTFDVELPLKELFHAPTIADLAEIIKEIVEVDGKTERQKEKKIDLDLHSEVILDSDIVPTNSYPNITTKPNSILLTGATGFLGAFLLHQLLQKTTADIYCLIRAENITQAQQRIENKLKSYLLWDAAVYKRIIPVVGDLSQPLLGLSKARFAEIAEAVDVIYHNGAWVNFTYPYSQLKAANVLGTQEVLRLAVQNKVKPVHFISTIGVVGAADRNLEIVSETTPIDRSEQIKSGYTQSKWVAEKLVTIARDRKIPITIYRPGRISGHSQTGVCNPDDHTFRMIRGCIQLGSVSQDDSLVNLTPVDYAVGAIVHLSSQPESLGKTFHLFNPQPTPWNEVVNSIISLGYPLKQLDYPQWRNELLATVEKCPDNPLSPLISTFAESKKPNKNTEENINRKLEASNTNSGLAETSIVCPPCDRQLLSIYFAYLIDNGFLIKASVNNIEFN